MKQARRQNVYATAHKWLVEAPLLMPCGNPTKSELIDCSCQFVNKSSFAGWGAIWNVDGGYNVLLNGAAQDSRCSYG